MSSDDIEFESNTEEIMQSNTDDTIREDDQTSTSQQALKQLNQLSSNNSSVSKVISASTSNVTSSLQKIEPKLTIPSGKIVYIKNPNGTPQTIRIGGSLAIGGSQAVSANNSNNHGNSTNSGVQKVQLLHLKNKNMVSTSPNSPRLILKSGNAPQKLYISSSGAGANLSSATGSGTTRTITVSQAQKMGLIVSSNKGNTSTPGTSSSTTTKTIILPASSSGTANIALKNQPTILNKGVKPIQSKVLLQSDNSIDGETKLKTASAPNIVKVAGTGQQVRVLQGKGLQYVRVLNAVSSGNTTTSTASKIVNGRQQQVIVQRKIVPQQGGSQIVAGGKPQQFVTKKLEVMPIGSTTKIIKKEPTTQAVKTSTTYLLNNVQKNIASSSIDIKPVTSSQSDSFEITETKDELTSGAVKKFASRTYSLSTDRKSKSPEPNQSSLMYSTLKLPSPEPIEGNNLYHFFNFRFV